MGDDGEDWDRGARCSRGRGRGSRRSGRGARVPGGARAGCAPTAKIEVPKEPITINLNIKRDADIRVRVEDKAKEDIAAKPDVF